MLPTHGNDEPAPPDEDVIPTVRYSLPDLLAELKRERVSSSFALEKLHQTEIGKLFHAQPKRQRAKPSP